MVLCPQPLKPSISATRSVARPRMEPLFAMGDCSTPSFTHPPTHPFIHPSIHDQAYRIRLQGEGKKKRGTAICLSPIKYASVKDSWWPLFRRELISPDYARAVLFSDMLTTSVSLNLLRSSPPPFKFLPKSHPIRLGAPRNRPTVYGYAVYCVILGTRAVVSTPTTTTTTTTSLVRSMPAFERGAHRGQA
ncbi:unnamed protein product [Periconia digitata]|uniref:Uncharacterized protein n=1 Tax=Periconia digitata TaxID=1303443 RepID=A0A9W4XQD8_9PLEO|nr:unnamed protein product [Periconia digitata]